MCQNNSEKIKCIIEKMTLKQKVEFLSGADDWHTKAFEDLGIPSIQMNDGPNGLRIEHNDNKNQSYPAVCYPAISTIASSWDKNQFAKLAKVLAQEAKSQDVDIVLGPGVNIKRSPLCGRNFEYMSEDPVLSSKLATEYIKVLQDNGVSACIKHFACNNQEYRRMVTNVIVSQRALHEIYLKSFQEAIIKGKPHCVMNSYNRVNSVQMSDNSYLLNDVLREQWGFDGIVISDWGSVNNRAEGVKSRMNLEMPNSGGKFDNDVYNALKDGTLTEQQLDICVYDLLKFVFFCADRRTPKTQFDYKQAHKIAQSIAKESVVLLKNKDNILPLSPKAKIAVIGQSAELPRFQGGGSAQVNPVMLENPLEELSKVFDVSYSQGYNIDEDILTKEQINEAVNTAKKCDYVVFFAALPDRYESEYFDRIDISLPNNQNELIQALSAIKPVVVVLSNGSAIEMPWIGDVYAVLETYLLGEACGSVIADILCGKINPSGKLTETFPKRIEDTPSYLSANNEYNDIIYNEDIYVGYKYYEKKKIQPLFPFGYGLSYTTFEYSNVRINKDELYSDETITLSVDVKNTGKTSGKEIVQLYFSNNTKKVTAPLKQLCDFEKVELAPNQIKTVTFKVPVKEFSVYSQSEQKWVLWSGKYSLCVGASSQDVKHTIDFNVCSDYSVKLENSHNITFAQLLDNKQTADMAKQLLKLMEEDKALQNDTNYIRLGQSKLLTYPIRNMCDLVNKDLAQKIEQTIKDALDGLK